MTPEGQFTHAVPEMRAALLRGEHKIAQQMRSSSISLPAGRMLCESGTSDRYVYRFREGWAGSVHTLPDGRSQIFHLHLPGDFCALQHLTVSQVQCGVRALSRVVIERMPASLFLRAMLEDLDIATWSVWHLSQEARYSSRWMAALGRGHAEERMALLLVSLRDRLAAGGQIEPNALAYPMPLIQSELAECLGLTPVHVNRVLRRLRERGLVHWRAGTLTILDFDQLRWCAQALLESSMCSRGPNRMTSAAPQDAATQSRTEAHPLFGRFAAGAAPRD